MHERRNLVLLNAKRSDLHVVRGIVVASFVVNSLRSKICSGRVLTLCGTESQIEKQCRACPEGLPRGLAQRAEEGWHNEHRSKTMSRARLAARVGMLWPCAKNPAAPAQHRSCLPPVPLSFD